MLCGDTCENSTCLCQACIEDLPYINTACASCGLPLEHHNGESSICGQCQSEPTPIQHCISIFHYDSPVDYLIKHMKYHNQLSVADLMGKMIAKKVKSIGQNLPDLIIPVPLHVERLKQRGYNQAIEIGRLVSRDLNIPLDHTACTRVKHTLPQFDIPAAERSDNIKNAFEVSRQLDAKHVALIDDVMTTGSTAREIATVLTQNGVTQVDVWTCARATIA